MTRVQGGTTKPKVVIVHSSNEMYGADRMLLRVIKAIEPVCELLVLLPDDVVAKNSLSLHLKSQGIAFDVRSLPILRRAYLTPANVLPLLRRTYNLWAFLRKQQPDVVWVATSACLLAAPASMLSGTRTRVLHAQEIWGGLERRLLAALARFCTAIVAISPSVKDAVGESLKRRTDVIANMTEPVERSSQPTSPHGPVYLVASRWNAWKGHGTLLNAWQDAGEPGLLLIAGGPPPVGASVDVRGMVKDLGLRCVEFLGELDSLESAYARTNAVIMPSDEPEPFGLIAIEAFAHGRPVIATSGGGLGDIITHDVDGWLFENRNGSQLVKILKSVTNGALAGAGDAAYKTWERRFSPGVFEHAIRSLILRAVGAHRMDRGAE